jgi:transcriptional regulator with XRE-family HTH domain
VSRREAPERYRHDQEKLGAALRALREAAGLTGTEAAQRTHMSQPKISKIETAVLLPSVDDVETLVTLYRAEPAQREELLELASALHATYESARTIIRRGAARKQRQIAAIEAQTAHVRTFQLALIPGLLQTAEYMRRVFGSGMDPADVARMVTARQERQRGLYDASKRFTFVLTEGALRLRPGPADVVQAQLHHVVSLSTLATVQLGVIPWAAEVHDVPLHGFHVYDSRLVVVGLETSTATFTDPRDVARYLELFESLQHAAVFGDAARAVITRIAADLG